MTSHQEQVIEPEEDLHTVNALSSITQQQIRIESDTINLNVRMLNSIQRKTEFVCDWATSYTKNMNSLTLFY